VGGGKHAARLARGCGAWVRARPGAGWAGLQAARSLGAAAGRRPVPALGHPRICLQMVR
jgi:hypothetical protein